VISKNDQVFRLLLDFQAKKYRHKKTRKNANSDTILVVATLFLGDLFMTAPLISSIKKAFPSKKIILVCREELEKISLHIGVDYVIPALKPTKKSINQINNISGGSLHSVYCIFSGRWLPATIKLNANEIISFYEPADRWNHLVTDIIPFPDNCMSSVEIPMLMAKEKKYNINSIPVDLWKPSGSYAVLHVGARSKSRRMPTFLIPVIVDILTRHNLDIVITSGPGEFKDYDLLKNSISKEIFKNISFDLGSKELHNIVPVINSASIVIGVDTGVMHMSKVMGTPTLVLMGQSHPELFGGDNVFSRSIHLGIDNLDCRDKKTFQGIRKDWIYRCDRDECLFDDLPCINLIDSSLIGESIGYLLKYSLNNASSSIKN